jgi:hypothetical protein
VNHGKGYNGKKKGKEVHEMGRIYLRGNVWWVQYSRSGKPYRESSHSEKKTEAEKLLRRREGEIEQGTFAGLQSERTTFDDLAKDLETDYQLNELKSLSRVQLSIAHLKERFEGWKAKNITSGAIKKYIVARKAEGASKRAQRRLKKNQPTTRLPFADP